MGSRVSFLVVCCCAMASVAVAQQPKRPAAKAPAKTARPAAKKPAPKPAAPKAAPSEPEKPPAPPPPDLVVKTTYVAGDKTTVSTTSAKGDRARVDYAGEMSVVTQCDTGQLVQIADQTRRVLVSPIDSSSAAAAAKKTGGVITYTTTVTDTGETKTLFGQSARHLKVVVAKDPSPDACDKKKQRIETDGWFIEQPAALACSAHAHKPAFAVTNGCRDDVKYVDAATASGYPLAYTATTTIDDDKPTTMTMEVTAFDRTTLPDTLFASPAGYNEVKTLAELTAPAKKPGDVRVGVLAVASKVKDDLSLRDLTDALVVSLNDANVDAVALDASSAATAMSEAREKSCDYILVTDVTDIRKPAHGLMARVSGAKDFGAKVEFLLTAPGSPAPMLSGSGRSGASTLQAAVKAAETVSRYVTPMGLLGSRFSFMQTYAAVAGQTGAVPMQSPDPVMSTLFSVLNSATGTEEQSHELHESAEAAVAAAMEKEVDAIAAKLVRK